MEGQPACTYSSHLVDISALYIHIVRLSIIEIKNERLLKSNYNNIGLQVNYLFAPLSYSNSLWLLCSMYLCTIVGFIYVAEPILNARETWKEQNICFEHKKPQFRNQLKRIIECALKLCFNNLVLQFPWKELNIWFG